MEIYNKLVRDKIPEIIKLDGRNPNINILTDKMYKQELDKKLLEEVNEYLKDDNYEELADVLEVIMAILEYKKVAFKEIEKIRIDKKEKRGGFADKVFLKEVE